jgi:hypothetical protein
MPEHAQPYEKASRKLSYWEIIVNNFTGGIFWALGATVGLALIFTLLSLIAPYLDVIPIIGTFISDIIDFILATNPNFQPE